MFVTAVPDSFLGVLLVGDEFFIQESVWHVLLHFFPGGFFVGEWCVSVLLILSILVVAISSRREFRPWRSWRSSLPG